MLESDQTIDLSWDWHGLSESICQFGPVDTKSLPNLGARAMVECHTKHVHEIGESCASETIPMLRKVGQFNNSDTQVGSCDNAWVATRNEANLVLFRGDLLSSTTHDGGNQQQK